MNQRNLSAMALLISGFFLFSIDLKAQRQPRVEQVRAGQTASGTLEKSDDPKGHTPAGVWDYWVYEGRKGEKIRITVRSEAFTPYASIAIGKLGSEKDFANLQLLDGQSGRRFAGGELTLPEEDKYLIMVSSLDYLGAYTVLVEQIAPPVVSAPPPAILPGEMRIASIDDSDFKGAYGSYRIDDWEIQALKGERFRIWVYPLTPELGEPTISVGVGRGITFREGFNAVDAYFTGDNARVKEVTFPEASKYTIRLQSEFNGQPIRYKLFAESLGLPDDAARVPNDNNFGNPIATDNEMSLTVRYTNQLHQLIYRVEFRMDFKKPVISGNTEADRVVVLAHVSCGGIKKIQPISLALYRGSTLIGAARPSADWNALSTNTRGGKIIEYVCKCQGWYPFTKQLER